MTWRSLSRSCPPRSGDAADERWIEEHGLLTDNPLFEEIAHASNLLRTNPQLGKIVRRGRSVIHRLLVPSGWHLYYRYLAERHRVEIVAIWYATRGDEPAL